MGQIYYLACWRRPWPGSAASRATVPAEPRTPVVTTENAGGRLSCLVSWGLAASTPIPDVPQAEAWTVGPGRGPPPCSRRRPWSCARPCREPALAAPGQTRGGLAAARGGPRSPRALISTDLQEEAAGPPGGAGVTVTDLAVCRRMSHSTSHRATRTRDLPLALQQSPPAASWGGAALARPPDAAPAGGAIAVLAKTCQRADLGGGDGSSKRPPSGYVHREIQHVRSCCGAAQHARQHWLNGAQSGRQALAPRQATAGVAGRPRPVWRGRRSSRMPASAIRC